MLFRASLPSLTGMSTSRLWSGSLVKISVTSPIYTAREDKSEASMHWSEADMRRSEAGMHWSEADMHRSEANIQRCVVWHGSEADMHKNAAFLIQLTCTIISNVHVQLL